MAPRDKLLETVGGSPLLRVMAHRAREASSSVTVLLRPGRTARATALEGMDVDRFETPDALEGMGGSLRAGCERLSAAPALLVLLADLPDITADDMKRVLSARSRTPDNLIWRGATADGQPGHPILFDQAAFGILLNLRGDRGAHSEIQDLSRSGNVHLVPLPGQNARRDLDTSDDWAEWRRDNA